MEENGMTDKQFNGFLRFIISDLESIREKTDDKKEVEERLDKMIEILQKNLRRLSWKRINTIEVNYVITKKEIKETVGVWINIQILTVFLIYKIHLETSFSVIIYIQL